MVKKVVLTVPVEWLHYSRHQFHWNNAALCSHPLVVEAYYTVQWWQTPWPLSSFSAASSRHHNNYFSGMNWSCLELCNWHWNWTECKELLYPSTHERFNQNDLPSPKQPRKFELSDWSVSLCIERKSISNSWNEQHWSFVFRPKFYVCNCPA